jgi:gamma-glutamyltranspeptidase/glutathione hydrolase
MTRTAQAYNGMVVSPHRLASEAGLTILRRGGNAVEAAVAAAATLCVVYPHMTGLGGDAFWLILPAGAAEPVFIDACGRSARLGSREWYSERGFASVPALGPEAALTMAGAVSGWDLALKLARNWPVRYKRLTLGDLFLDAVYLAEEGFPVSGHMAELARRNAPTLRGNRAFVRQFHFDGGTPEAGSRLRLPALAKTFRQLVKDGLDSFYRGPLADSMALELEEAGSPLRLEDFHAHSAETRPPLSLDIPEGRLFNCPPPTQGLASLIILGLVSRLAERPGCDLRDPVMLVHCIVEATKLAFGIRKRHVADPDHMTCNPDDFLTGPALDALAAEISLDSALPWSASEVTGDTVWLGAMDSAGNAVSCIQSIYHGFGSGVALPESGVTWHNRGLGFAFAPGRPNSLAVYKKPLHTLNPALALLADGRVLAYGTMGGDGQPQTQAAVFARYAMLGMDLQRGIALPRWVIGRTWGAPGPGLKIEEDFPPEVYSRLTALGHLVEKEDACSSLMGHAGALVCHPDGLLEGASDPRCDGIAACY